MTDAWEERFNQAVALREADRFSEALELFEVLLSEGPSGIARRAAVLGELGGIHLFDVGDPCRSEHYYRRCVELSPQSEMASLGLFHSLVDQHRILEALDEMKRFVSLRESDEYTRLLDEIRRGSLRSRGK